MPVFTRSFIFNTVAFSLIAMSCCALAGDGDVAVTAGASPADKQSNPPEQNWNLHIQNTDIVQGYPAFPAKYTGIDSLPPGGETRETVSLDIMFGLRLWSGAEIHVDGMLWQGYGVGDAHGAAGFPNGEAFRLGTAVPNVNFSRIILRQTIGLGGEQEPVADDPLHLAGMQDVSRITITVGRMSVKDIFDNNAYANDPRTQFLNWSLMANGAWDYPADSLGYMSGLAIELNQPDWTARYGFFQVPRVSNGTALDLHVAESWSMVTELERRYKIKDHPGAVRLLAYDEQAHMGSFQEALDSPVRPADITATRAYRDKYGFGLNADQEIVKDVGVFTRLGWNNGTTEPWAFTDVDRTVSAGVSIKGSFWKRPDDTFAVAGVVNGITSVHQKFLAAGGTGILVGDGALSYGPEKVLETYYDIRVMKGVNVALDYQLIGNPAFNRDRGPVSFFSGRLHWEF